MELEAEQVTKSIVYIRIFSARSLQLRHTFMIDCEPLHHGLFVCKNEVRFFSKMNCFWDIAVKRFEKPASFLNDFDRIISKAVPFHKKADLIFVISAEIRAWKNPI